MASGYEQDEDYGGPAPTLWGGIVAAIVMIGIVAGIFFLLMPA